MRILTLILFVCGIQFTSTSYADYLPENHLDRQDHVSNLYSIDEATFNRLIDQVVAVYQPITQKNFGMDLMGRRDWQNSKVNAGSTLTNKTFILDFFGGFARRPEVTPDVFTLVICHELGHTIGGFPLRNNWSAMEGQADYFSTQVCARKIWADDVAVNETFRGKVSDAITQGCDSVWAGTNEQNICYRTGQAALSLATLLASIGSNQTSPPHVETPDQTVVSSTSDKHPPAQCRLDTLIQGSLCVAQTNETKIPGVRNSNDGPRDAAMQSCMKASGYQIGLRPACWFKE